MKITQADIAKKLNLSVTTVSRALQGDSNINDETREEVQALATKLNYMGRSSSKSKQIQPLRTIGVLVRTPDPRDSWAPDAIASGYLAGMSRIAPSLNISLMIHHVNYGEEDLILKPESQPPMMRDKSLDGLILIHHFQDDIVSRLASQWPVVNLVHDFPVGIKGDLISMHNSGGIRKIVNLLFEKGHRNIGFCGFRPGLTWSQARLGAFMQSMHEKGLEINQKNILDKADPDHIINAREEGVTAWVCSVDRIAYKIVRALTDADVSVPEDVAITGFDAVPPLLNCPQITTVKPPLEEMGSACLHAILNRLKNPQISPIKSFYTCDIIEGSST